MCVCLIVNEFGVCVYVRPWPPHAWLFICLFAVSVSVSCFVSKGHAERADGVYSGIPSLGVFLCLCVSCYGSRWDKLHKRVATMQFLL